MTTDSRIQRVNENMSYIPGILLKEDIQSICDELAALKAENKKYHDLFSSGTDRIMELEQENERLKEEIKKEITIQYKLVDDVKSLTAELSEARKAGRNEAIDDVISVFNKMADNGMSITLQHRTKRTEILSSLKL